MPLPLLLLLLLVRYKFVHIWPLKGTRSEWPPREKEKVKIFKKLLLVF